MLNKKKKERKKKEAGAQQTEKREIFVEPDLVKEANAPKPEESSTREEESPLSSGEAAPGEEETVPKEEETVPNPEEDGTRAKTLSDEAIPGGEESALNPEEDGSREEESPSGEAAPGEEKETANFKDAEFTEVERRRRAKNAPPEKPKKWKKRTWVLLIVILFIVAVLLTFGYSVYSEYARTESVDGDEVTVSIEEGSTTRQMAAVLRDAGVIRYETSFLLKTYFSGNQGKLRYGEYVLNDGICLNDLMEVLTTGGAPKEELTFTIPEGYSIPMIARKLEEEEVMSADEFLTAVENAAEDFEYADELPEADAVLYQLEGYMVPDTYYLSENMTAQELVDKILDEFTEYYDGLRRMRTIAVNMSMEEVLTRASLVQKETERTEEYATVAGVINNRLNQDMYLQFDSTVAYGVTDGLYGLDRVLYSHLETESPYNTYLHKGLPAGPICSPSREAIDGVLYPEEHDYLYFQTDQAKNDGSNLYFKTYEEHEAAAATTTEAGEETTTEGDEKTTTVPGAQGE